MKISKMLGLGLALSMIVVPTTKSFAAVGTVGNGQGVAVNIEAKTTTVNVTIPSAAPMVFNADGSNTVPTNFEIKNNSKLSGVHLETANFNASGSGWKLAQVSDDLSTLPVDQKVITLKLGATGNEKEVVPAGSAAQAETGTATFAPSDFTIPAEGTNTLSFVLDRGSFSSPVSNGKAFDMTLDFKFN